MAHTARGHQGTPATLSPITLLPLIMLLQPHSLSAVSQIWEQPSVFPPQAFCMALSIVPQRQRPDSIGCPSLNSIPTSHTAHSPY